MRNVEYILWTHNNVTNNDYNNIWKFYERYVWVWATDTNFEKIKFTQMQTDFNGTVQAMWRDWQENGNRNEQHSELIAAF